MNGSIRRILFIGAGAKRLASAVVEDRSSRSSSSCSVQSEFSVQISSALVCSAPSRAPKKAHHPVNNTSTSN